MPSAVERWFARFERVPALLSPDYLKEREIVSQSVHWVIVTGQITVKKQGKVKSDSAPKMQRRGSEGKLFVVRSWFHRLLAVPKSLRDQLLVELPALNALRTGEVSSLKVEYIDFAYGDLFVMDSKKHELLPVPLDGTVAVHLARYIEERQIVSGYLFLPRRRRKPGNKSVGASLTEWAITHRWAVLCGVAGIPRMNPRMGRAFRACEELNREGNTIYDVMAILRHDDIQSTEHYLSRLIDYETVKAHFNRGKRSPFASACMRSNACPNAIEGCFCRHFVACSKPQIPEVKKIG